MSRFVSLALASAGCAVRPPAEEATLEKLDIDRRQDAPAAQPGLPPDARGSR